MSKIGFAIVFFFIVGKSYSQQPGYLVLIDADNDQVFRVRIGDTVYNSSELGHLTIPYLKDSTYNLAIGFPRKIYPERIFSIKMNKKDQGFQLKNLGEKGWALYNWQTRELKMPITDSALSQGIPERGIKKEDAFSRLMAAVVNDTSVMYNAFVSQKIVKDSAVTQPNEQAIKTDSSVTADNNAKKNVPIVAPAADHSKKEKAIVKSKLPSIRKLSERSTPTAKRLTYIDASKEGSVDTVTLFIPLENGVAISSNDTAKKITPVKGKKTGKGTGIKSDSAANKLASANIDCKNSAIDSDVDSLRENILRANTIDSKITEAKKYFRMKCFSVAQVKILSESFASDKSKYSFFQAAYPYLSDRANTGQLLTVLSDAIYVNRFKKEMAVDK